MYLVFFLLVFSLDFFSFDFFLLFLDLSSLSLFVLILLLAAHCIVSFNLNGYFIDLIICSVN